MKIKINHNDTDLWCLYSKEKIEVGDKYIEVVEEYLDEEITKVYAYWYLNEVVEECLESDDKEPELEIEDS